MPQPEPNYANLTDQALLQRFDESGDRLALAMVIRRHHDVVLTVCRHLLGTTADADDAYQATFLVLIRGVSKIRKPQSLSSWLYGVAYRVASRIRKQLARQLEAPEPLAMPAPDPLAALTAKEQLAATHEAVTDLPETLRRPMVLRYLAGMSNQEVADELSLTETAVEGRLKRAKARLRVRLAKQGVMLSAALVAIQQSASAAAVTSGVDVNAEALIDATVSCCDQWRTETEPFDDGSLMQLVQEEVNTMVTNQLTRTAIFAGICIAAAGLVVVPQWSYLSMSQVAQAQQGNDSLFSDEDENDVVVSATAPAGGARRPVDIRAVSARRGNLPDQTFSTNYAVRDKILKTINSNARVDFFDTPLSEAVAMLGAKHDLQIILDTNALDEEGITGDTPINLQVSDIMLRSILNLMLRQLHLTYTIRDEVLLITTHNHVERETRVYHFDPNWTMQPKQIIEAIVMHIEPSSWSEVGGNATISEWKSGAIVSQSLQAHAKIQQLLRQLEATRSR